MLWFLSCLLIFASSVSWVSGVHPVQEILRAYAFPLFLGNFGMVWVLFLRSIQRYRYWWIGAHLLCCLYYVHVGYNATFRGALRNFPLSLDLLEVKVEGESILRSNEVIAPLFVAEIGQTSVNREQFPFLVKEPAKKLFLSSTVQPSEIITDLGEGVDPALLANYDIPEKGKLTIGVIDLDPSFSSESIERNRVMLRRFGTLVRFREHPVYVVLRTYSTAHSGLYGTFRWGSRTRDLTPWRTLNDLWRFKSGVFVLGGNANMPK